MFSSKENNKVAQDYSNTSNIILKGTTLTGDIEAFGNIRVEGRIKGNLKTKSKVVIGKSGYVDGNIMAQNADIEGEVKGKVEISEVLTLKPTAMVNGDIFTNKLIVEAGAKFNGACQMGNVIKEITLSDAKNGQTAAGETPAKTV